MDAKTNSEQAVIIYFNYGINGLASLHKLENKLRQVITLNKVGEYDGHEIATDDSDGILYMYGPNAETLLKAIKPTLEATEFMKGATVLVQFGPLGEGVKKLKLNYKDKHEELQFIYDSLINE